MPSTPSVPQAPDPEKVAATNYKYNLKAQEGSLVDQSNPYGSLTYTSKVDPATGVPTYTANTNLNQEQQAIFNNQQGFKQTSGDTANKLLTNSAGMYSKPQDFSNQAGGLTKQLLDQETSYLNPVFDRQKSQLDSKLVNQGIMPDSPAYKNQMMDLERNQNSSITNFLATTEPQAFDQVVKQYGIPLQTAQSLASGAIPGTPANVNTYAAQTAPVNYGQIANQGFANQMAAYNAQSGANNNFLGGIGGILGSSLGTSILGPFGTAIGGALGNGASQLFGAGPGSWAPQTYAG